MNATGIPLKEPAVSAAAGDMEQLERAYIDASTRVPVLMFYTSAIAWLILGTVLAALVSWEHWFPDVGTAPPGSHERDGLRLGVNGRNGHSGLVDGKIVPSDVAISTLARCRRCILERGRA